MPIKIPNTLPAVEVLNRENIFIMREARAQTQDIRPLRIALVNLMPDKITTETQFARLLSNTPLQIREAIYQCAPFIGFPRTLNAIAVFNETVRERNIPLPLENTGTTTDETRHEKGLEIQKALYGEEVKTAMASLPGEYKDVIPAILTDFCFGDFYTRDGLSVQERELLSLVVLTALGAEKQLPAHIVGAMKAGNDKETLLAAMVQAIPYIGLPYALTTINLIKEANPESYEPIYK